MCQMYRDTYCCDGGSVTDAHGGKHTGDDTQHCADDSGGVETARELCRVHVRTVGDTRRSGDRQQRGPCLQRRVSGHLLQLNG